MSWDRTWEEIYGAGRQVNRYPTEQFVRFLARHYYQAPDRSEVRILDLGCGAGNNLWYAAREGFAVYGIDGSAAAISYVRERLAQEGVRASLRVGDMADLPYESAFFQVVLDRCSIACNTLDHARKIAAEVVRVLQPGGRLLTLMYGESCSDRRFGEEYQPKTYRGISQGPLTGLGCVRLYSLREIGDLFALLRMISATLETHSEVVPETGQVIERWVVTFEKLSS